MPDASAAFDVHVRAHQQAYLDGLCALVRLPTVSAQRSGIDLTARAFGRFLHAFAGHPV